VNTDFLFKTIENVFTWFLSLVGITFFSGSSVHLNASIDPEGALRNIQMAKEIVGAICAVAVTAATIVKIIYDIKKGK
jgi:hypothetical protein